MTTQIACEAPDTLITAIKPKNATTTTTTTTTASMGEAFQYKENLLMCLPFPENATVMNGLRKKFPTIHFTYKHIEIIVTGDRYKHADIIPDELWKETTILCTLGALPPTIELASSIKFIHFFSAGVDHIAKHPIYTNTDIMLTTSSGIHGPMISEWCLMQILANSHKQKQLIDWQRERTWGSHVAMGALKDAVGMRLAVLGYGSIGRQTARVCKALGMDVIAFTATPRKTEESKRDTGYVVPGTGDIEGTIPSAWYSGLEKESLHNFLSQDIDVLLIAVPLTQETKYFIGAEEFAILGKKNAMVINISRGTIIVQDELIKACEKPLSEGGLRGAAVDVTDPEPLGPDSPLWNVDNIAVTPHISGLSVSYMERSLQILVRNLAAFESGRPLLNVVNRSKGY